MPWLGAAAIKGGSLRLSLDLAWRMAGRPGYVAHYIDTVADEISDGRGGNEGSPDEEMSPSPEERSSIHREAQGTNGSDGVVRSAL